jgi:hypothetical protein
VYNAQKSPVLHSNVYPSLNEELINAQQPLSNLNCTFVEDEISGTPGVVIIDTNRETIPRVGYTIL